MSSITGFNWVAHGTTLKRDTPTKAALLLLLWLMGSLPRATRAEMRGDPRLLEHAATIYRDNLDKLQTWQGAVTYSQRSRDKNDQSGYILIECKIDFAAATRPRRVRYDIATTKDAKLSGGRESARLPLSHRAGLIRDDEYYNVNYRGERGRRATVRSEPVARPGFNYLTFDPFYFYTDEGRFWDDYWRPLLKEARNPLLNATVRQEGSHVILTRMIGDSNSRSESITVIDIQQGGNVVKLEVSDRARGSESKTTQTWEWQSINGVFVPRVATLEQSPRSRERSVTLIWTVNTVNNPIDDDQFSLSNVGLRQGDYIHDTRNNKSVVIDDPSYPPSPEDKRRPAPPVSKSGWGSAIIVVNVVVILFLACAILYRRMRGTK